VKIIKNTKVSVEKSKLLNKKNNEKNNNKNKECEKELSIDSISEKRYKKYLLYIWTLLNIVLFSFLVIHYSKFQGDLTFLYDVEHYTDIATNGYTKKFQYAFFPLLPLIMRLFNMIGLPNITINIVNSVLSLLSAYLIFEISSKVYKNSEKISFLSGVFWLSSPIQVFSVIPYTESIFVFLSLLSFYFYKMKKNPLLLGIFLGLSVMCRSMGYIMFFVVFVFLMLELIKIIMDYKKYKLEIKKGNELEDNLFILDFKNNIKNKLKYMFITYIPATIISCLYPIYLHFKLGSWRYFIDVQYEYWWREKSNIFSILYKDIIKIFTLDTEYFLISFSIILMLIILSLSLFMVWYSLKNEKLNKIDLIILLIATILVIFSTERNVSVHAFSTSFYRYLYAIISVYLMFNDKTKTKNILVLIVLNYTILILLGIGVLAMGLFIC
jgi:hypothetical protein